MDGRVCFFWKAIVKTNNHRADGNKYFEGKRISMENLHLSFLAAAFTRESESKETKHEGKIV
jgi:hypothetical protein